MKRLPVLHFHERTERQRRNVLLLSTVLLIVSWKQVRLESFAGLEFATPLSNLEIKIAVSVALAYMLGHFFLLANEEMNAWTTSGELSERDRAFIVRYKARLEKYGWFKKILYWNQKTQPISLFSVLNRAMKRSLGPTAISTMLRSVTVEMLLPLAYAGTAGLLAWLPEAVQAFRVGLDSL